MGHPKWCGAYITLLNIVNIYSGFNCVFITLLYAACIKNEFVYADFGVKNI